MSLPSLFDGLSEVRGALTADLRGQPSQATGPEVGGGDASATAAAMSELAAAGSALGLGRLEILLVKGARKSTAAALRPDELLLVAVDPAKATTQIEKVLHAWATLEKPPASPPPPPLTAPSDASRPAPPPLPAAAPGKSPAAGGAPAPAPTRRSFRDDPWAGLRWSLVRGQLTEATARRRELGGAASGAAGRPGSERLAEPERERAMQVLLEGVGSVLAGDGMDGGRILRELAGPSQRNLSFRWLALHWSARAAMRSGNFTAARAQVKESLAVAQQLDIEARGVSQWTAAEVLAHDGDQGRALAWLAEARTRFERIADRWGIGQTWLAQARILVGGQREQEGLEAARQACAADPDWDQPSLFLAGRALLRDDLAGAEAILQPVASPAADRVRRLIEAIRQGTVIQADAGELLRESDGPPTERSIGALERVAERAPRLVQARQALAWMLLKVGRYADASTLFRALQAEPLAPADRASVMLGLGCVAHAQHAGRDPETALRAAVSGTCEALPDGAAGVGSGGQGAVFSGQLSALALPDLLEFLRSGRRTGLLICSSAAGMGAVRFREGWITGAASPATPRLGEVLVSAGRISGPALSAMAAPQDGDRPDHVLAERLVAEGLADATAVQEGIRRQIELTIRELVHWKEGEFAFNRAGESEPPGTEIPVEVDSQAVLLEVLEEMDEEASREG